MKHTIQEAQQALKLLMDNKERIIELCSQWKTVRRNGNEDVDAALEQHDNEEINRKIRKELEPFNDSQKVIIGFISRLEKYRCEFSDKDNIELYRQFLIDLQKLYSELVGKFFESSNYERNIYKLNIFFKITPNHFFMTDGVIYFEPDEAKIKARQKEKQKDADEQHRLMQEERRKFDEEQRMRREKEQANAVLIQQSEYTTGECITPQPQQRGTNLDQKTPDAGKPQQYTFDTVKIKAVYEFCIETNVISDSISVVDFMCAVSYADFKPIYKTAKFKGKCKYIINVLSWHINNPMSSEWYRNTAHSIDTEPNKCSGANVPYKWKRGANALK